MRLLIIFDSNKIDPSVIELFHYFSSQGHTLGIFDVAFDNPNTWVYEKLDSIEDFHLLTDAKIEYFQLCFCMYDSLSYVQKYNIYITSFLPDSLKESLFDIGADFFFIFKNQFNCDYSYTILNKPVENTLYLDDNNIVKIEITLSSIYDRFLKYGEYPEEKELKLDQNIVTASVNTLEELKKKRKKNYILSGEKYKLLSLLVGDHSARKILEELLQNNGLDNKRLYFLWNSIICAYIYANFEHVFEKADNSLIYKVLLEAQLYQSILDSKSQVIKKDPAYYYAQGVAAYRCNDFQNAKIMFEKFLTLIESAKENGDFYSNEMSVNGRFFFLLATIKTNVNEIDNDLLLSTTNDFSHKKLSEVYKTIIKISTSYCKQEKYHESYYSLNLYINLYNLYKNDSQRYLNRYVINRTLAKIHSTQAERGKSFTHQVQAIFWGTLLGIKKILSKLKSEHRKFRKITSKYIPRIKKILFTRLRFFTSYIHIYGPYEKRLLKMQNQYQGKSCFIIGNGPSLAIQDLNILKSKGAYCFACNKIYKVFEQTEWRPNFYACIDSAVFRQNYYSILNLGTYQKFFGKNLPMQPEIRKNFKHIVLNYDTKNIKKTKFNPKATYIYSGGTVTYVLITLAWMMGFRKIYLIGCDHNYDFFSGEKTGNVTSTSEVNNDYFTKNYMRPGETINIGNLNRSEQGYIIARDYITSHGGEIFNATRGGKLEVFPRVNLDDILQKLPEQRE